jgi:hypothetical protein
MLPIGVVVPTRNSVSLLPEHLASMRPWLDQVQEVVVVDSVSTDGTLDRLREELRHPQLQILQHPPGLYQSWNYAIQQLRAEYCYISTVGETLTPQGLQHLAEIMHTLHCDVVISRPDFVDLRGRPIRPSKWPIDDIVSSLRAREPFVLEGAALCFFTLLNYAEAFLGSSASNLYRTRCLQENPFPVDYGTAGDGGWGLEHCGHIRLGVTPRTFSTFREHPKSYARAEYAVDRLREQMLDRIRRTLREEEARSPGFAAQARQLQVEQIIQLLTAKLRYQQQIEQRRRSLWPWSLNPAAWLARGRRSAKARELARLKAAGLALLFPLDVHKRG